MDMLSAHNGGIVKALNVNVYGNGTETLILSHGFGTDQTIWQYLIPYLACYFKVMVFDLVFSPNVKPELYNSKKYSNFEAYAQDLVSILDQLDVKRSIYLGHSMGAMIGCTAAIKRPELFKQLILLNGSPRYLNAKGYNGGFERSQINTFFSEINRNYSNWVNGFAPVAIGVNNKAAITKFEFILERINPKVTLSVATTVFLNDNRQILPRVKLPCTIIQSETDYIVPKSVPFYMKTKLGGHARVMILKSIGHFPMLTDYSLLLKVVKKLLYIDT